MWLENSSMFIKEMGILGILGWNAWLDIKKQQISLAASGILAIAGFIWAWHGNRLGFSYFLGIFTGFCVVGLGVLTKGEIGIGDCILVLELGMALEWERLVVSLMLGLLACAIVSGILMFVLHKGRKTRIPFAPFLFLGYIGGMLL